MKIVFRIHYIPSLFPLRSKVNHHEPKPTPHHAQRRIRARKHQRQKLVPCSKYQPVHKRRVHHQRNRNGVVQQREAIQKKHPRPHWDGRKLLEGVQEEQEPGYRVDCFEREFRGGEQEWEEGDVACDCEGAEGGEIPSVC